MSVCASIICPECGKLYDDSARRVCIGKCRHSICLSCKNSLTPPSCPICDEVDAFKETVYNHQTENFLLDFQKSLSEDDIEKFAKDLENLGHGPCSKCNVFTKKLRVCTQCTPFVMPNSSGGWRLSYWLEGRNSNLRAKSAAICASCAIDHHEEQKVINLASIDGISGDFEIDSLINLRILIESNWQRDIDAGKTSLHAVKPKSIALQWRIQNRIDEIRKGSYENSQNLLNHRIFQILNTRTLLETSLAEVRKQLKLLSDLRKANMMNQKSAFQNLAQMLKSTGTRDNLKIAEEILENCKLLPTDLLTQKEYDQYNKEASNQLFRLTVEMEKKHPDRRTDKDFLRSEVMKEEWIKAKEGIIAGDLAIDECFHNLITFTNEGQQEFAQYPDPLLNELLNLTTYIENHQGIAVKQLKLDEANLKKLKACVDEQMAALMTTKCLKSLRFARIYNSERKKLVMKYEDASLKVDWDILEKLSKL